jgi:hypothetical protein
MRFIFLKPDLQLITIYLALDIISQQGKIKLLFSTIDLKP